MFEYLVCSFILLIPIIFFKSNITKITIFIYWYPITIMIGLYFGMEPIRIVSKYIGYYEEFIPIASISAIVSYFSFLFIIWPIRNKEFTYNTLPFGNDSKLLFFILFLISLLLAYPKAMLIGNSRFGSMGSLVIFFYVLIFLSNNIKSMINKLALLFVLFVFVRGERVDFILMLLFPLLIFKMDVRVNKIYIFVFGMLIFFIGTYSGLSRLNINVDLELYLTFLKYSFLNFGTAIDVVHVYLSSFYYYSIHGSSPEPIINIIGSFIPFSGIGGVNSDYNLAIMLRKDIDNLGGGLFYSVGAVFLGPFGVIMMGIIYGLIYKYLFVIKKLAIFFLIFWLLQFRLQWYGMTYLGTQFLLVTIVIIGLFIINKALRRNNVS